MTRPTIPVAAAQAQADQALLPGQVPVMAELVRYLQSQELPLDTPVAAPVVGAAPEVIQPQQAARGAAAMPVRLVETTPAIPAPQTQAGAVVVLTMCLHTHQAAQEVPAS